MSEFNPVCKEVTFTKYAASDGILCDTKQNCIAYEAVLALKSLFDAETAYGELNAKQAADVVLNNAKLIRSILAAIGK